ncbi:MAG: hypothetical protein ABI378_08305 [Chitinophagaceae bacterium]
MSDFSQIWNPGDEGKNLLTEAQMQGYLEGRLSDEERRIVEESLSNESPESDALEGLQLLTEEERNALHLKLNAELRKSLNKKRKHRRDMPSQRWTVLAILLILLLAVLAYVVLFFVKKSV